MRVFIKYYISWIQMKNKDFKNGGIMNYNICTEHQPNHKTQFVFLKIVPVILGHIQNIKLQPRTGSLSKCSC